MSAAIVIDDNVMHSILTKVSELQDGIGVALRREGEDRAVVLYLLERAAAALSDELETLVMDDWQKRRAAASKENGGNDGIQA